MDNLEIQRKTWDVLAQVDPMWAILTDDQKLGGKWKPAEFFEEGRIEVNALVSELKSLGLPVAMGDVLDFGCGIGRLSQAFCNHFRSCTGVDISPLMIVKAAEFNRFPDRCRYVVNEAPDLHQFPDGSFDLVYSNIVLQHVHPGIAKRYIRDFVRIVRPGGLIVFQIPYWIHWKRRVQWRRRLFELLVRLGLQGQFLITRLKMNPMRMSFLRRETIEKILTESGCSLRDVKSWTDGEIGSCRYLAVKTLASVTKI